MSKIFKKSNFRILFFISAFVLLLMPMISLLSFAQEEGSVKQFIDQVAQSLINTMKASSSTESKRSQIKTIIDKNFDVVWMSKFAMGVYYDKLSDDQKSRYASLYLSYLLNNYFPILMKYDSDDSYTILRTEKVDTKDYDVRIKLVTTKSENPIMLNYRVRTGDAMDYKCLDMVVEGISTLVSQRAEFISIVQSSGIDAFLKQLESQHVKSIEYNTGE